VSRIRALTAVSLRQISRDPKALFSMFALPIVIAVVIGLATQTSDRVRVGVATEQSGPEARALMQRLDSRDDMTTFEYSTPLELERALRRGTIDAGAIIPRDYDHAIRAGQRPRVELVAGPTSTAALIPLRAAVMTPRAAAGRSVVRQETIGGATTAGGLVYRGPANLVLFAFITSIAAAGTLIEARRLGVITRILTTPTRSRTLLVGVSTSRYTFAILQAVFVVVVGGLAFGMQWGNPLGAAALIAAFALVGTSAALLVASLTTSSHLANAIGAPIGAALGMLGGCMWPLETVGPTMTRIGHLTPHAWAMDGWLTLLDGGGLAQIVKPVVALCAFAAVLFPVATWNLHRTTMRSARTMQ
jgi:ABC-2 type transport system permease protein